MKYRMYDDCSAYVPTSTFYSLLVQHHIEQLSFPCLLSRGYHLHHVTRFVWMNQGMSISIISFTSINLIRIIYHRI